jgi:hypothetical protein
MSKNLKCSLCPFRKTPQCTRRPFQCFVKKNFGEEEKTMAPLSILPGRIRFESQYLIGKPHICGYLKESIVNYFGGVTEVTANHKTGRILVRFDERQIDRQALTQYINQVMKEGAERAANNWQFLTEEKNSRPPVARHALHALADVITHAILPMPLNALIPMAIKVATGR